MTVVESLRSQRPFRRLRWLVSRPRTILRRRGRERSRPALTKAVAAARTRPISTAKTSHLFIPALSDVLLAVNKSVEKASRAIASKFADPGTSMPVQRNCLGFPTSLQSNMVTTSSGAQALISAGSKDLSSKWGRKGLLRVKIYDFALYVNPRHVSASVTSHRRQDRSGAPHAHPQPRCSCNDATSDTEQRSRRFSFALRRPALADHHHPQSTHACICSPPTRRQHQQPVVQSTALTDRVRAATPQVEMSVCVRTARDLPLLMLRAEYTRILRRRMNAVGGSPDDAALRALLSYFRASALPQAATRRGCVRRGTVMQFSRARSGHLCATANGAPVATVHSPKLCEAVFDLYLGDAPVCGEAKAQAHVALEHMLGTHDAPSAPTLTPRLPSRRP